MANERQDTIVPTMNQVERACMTFRHDFGLLSQEEKECLRIDAQHWLQCWLKELNTIAPLSSNREEIAGWLREAADCFEMIGDEFLGERTLKEYSRKLRDRAAQVESMRCETCSKNRVTNWPTLTACPWRGCGGCFHHETMEATCQVEKK